MPKGPRWHTRARHHQELGVMALAEGEGVEAPETATWPLQETRPPARAGLVGARPLWDASGTRRRLPLPHPHCGPRRLWSPGREVSGRADALRGGGPVATMGTRSAGVPVCGQCRADVPPTGGTHTSKAQRRHQLWPIMGDAPHATNSYDVPQHVN